MSAVLTPIIGKKNYLNGYFPGFDPGVPVNLQTGVFERLAKKHSTRVRVRIRLDMIERADKARKIMKQRGCDWDKSVLRSVTAGAEFVRSARMLVSMLLRELALTGEVKIPVQYEYDEYSRAMKVEDTLDFKPGEVHELPVRAALLLLNRVPYSLFFEEPDARKNQKHAIAGLPSDSEPLRPGELSKVQEVQKEMQAKMDQREQEHRAEIEELRALIMSTRAPVDAEESSEGSTEEPEGDPEPPKPRGGQRRR